MCVTVQSLRIGSNAGMHTLLSDRFGGLYVKVAVALDIKCEEYSIGDGGMQLTMTSRNAHSGIAVSLGIGSGKL